MLEYMEDKSYKKAMEIADTIDWRRVKNGSMLNSVSEIYEFNGEYQKSREILFLAYDRSPGSRKIVYRLGTLSVKVNELTEAMDCYEEFVNLAPKDPNQYILKYKILKAQKAPVEQQIEALSDFKKAEYVEKWAYELAKLYHEAGMTAECLEECDDLILWFSEGKYVYQAMELKMQYKPLTPLQQEKYDNRNAELAKPRFKKKEAVQVKEPEEESKELAAEPDAVEEEPQQPSDFAKTMVMPPLKEILGEKKTELEEPADAFKVEGGDEETEETAEPEEAFEEEPEEIAEPEEAFEEEAEETAEPEEAFEEEAEEITEPEETFEEEPEEIAEPESVLSDDIRQLLEELENGVLTSDEEPVAQEEDEEIFEEEPEEDYEVEEEPEVKEEEFDEEDFDEEAFDEEAFREEEPEEEPEEESPLAELERLEAEEKHSRKSPGGVTFDTGFVVQGKYDLDATSEIGLKAGLTEEQKKLFSYFVPVRGMSEQIVDVLEADKNCNNRYGTSRTGNVLVIGRRGTGKTVLAVNIVKAIQKARKLKQGKVAIVTAESLNKKELPNIIEKLNGGALIIEGARKLNGRTIRELNDLMEEQTGELLFVLEEQRKPLEKMLAANPEFGRKFTSRLELPVFINDELVTFGQTYAKENGYRIDEMGILALYSCIDLQQKEDHAVTVAEVKDIIDDAIEHAQKANVKHLMKRVFGKHTDESDRVILTEKDFK